MGSHIRRWIVACVVALLTSALTPLASGVGQGAELPILVIISPPSGLGLPVGQHVGVRYRFTGEAPAILELAADGTVLAADWAEPGQAVTHAWTPATPGLHQLRVRALTPDGTMLGRAGLPVIGLPAGFRVRIP